MDPYEMLYESANLQKRILLEVSNKSKTKDLDAPQNLSLVVVPTMKLIQEYTIGLVDVVINKITAALKTLTKLPDFRTGAFLVGNTVRIEPLMEMIDILDATSIHCVDVYNSISAKKERRLRPYKTSMYGNDVLSVLKKCRKADDYNVEVQFAFNGELMYSLYNLLYMNTAYEVKYNTKIIDRMYKTNMLKSIDRVKMSDLCRKMFLEKNTRRILTKEEYDLVTQFLSHERNDSMASLLRKMNRLRLNLNKGYQYALDKVKTGLSNEDAVGVKMIDMVYTTTMTIVTTMCVVISDSIKYCTAIKTGLPVNK